MSNFDHMPINTFKVGSSIENIGREHPVYGQAPFTDERTQMERDMYRKPGQNNKQQGSGDFSDGPMVMKPKSMAKHPGAYKGERKYAGDSPYND